MTRSSLFRRYFVSYALAIRVPVAAAVLLVGLSVLADLRSRDELAHQSLLTDLARFTDYRLERLVDAMTTVASQEPIRRLSASRTSIDPLGDPIENYQIIVSRSSLQEQLNAIIRSSEFVRGVLVFFAESRSVLTIDGRYSFDEFLNRVHACHCVRWLPAVGKPLPGGSA